MAVARKVEDLVTWQVGCQVRDLVYDMTRQGRVAQDRKFCEQIRDAGASVPRNLAEGFGRFYPRDHARFVRIARASLNELQTHLQHGYTEGYWTEDDFTRAWRLSCRAMRATTRFLRYLEGFK